jgi:hypothetical protein
VRQLGYILIHQAAGLYDRLLRVASPAVVELYELVFVSNLAEFDEGWLGRTVPGVWR